MEFALTKINAVVDSALEDLMNSDSIDYAYVLQNGKCFNEKIQAGLNNVCEILDGNAKQFENVMKKLSQWNSSLEGLIDKHGNDEEICLIQKISSSGVLDLTDEEKNVLQKKIQARQFSLNREVCDLINQNILLQSLFQRIQNQIIQNEKLNENSINLIENIKKRYQEAINSDERKVKHMKHDDGSSECKVNNIENGTIDEKNEVKREMKKEDKKELKKEEKKDVRKEEKRDVRKEDEKEMKREGKREGKREKSVTESISNKGLQKKEYEEKIKRKSNMKDRNSQNQWDRFRYLLAGGVFYQTELSYLIKVPKNTLSKQEDLIISMASSDVLNNIGTYYNTLSNAIQIEPADLDINANIPCQISIPYNSISTSNREVVTLYKNYRDQEWIELETKEIPYEESKEGIKFAESFVPILNCTCVVVSKRKVEKFDINKAAVTIESKVDERVSLNLSPSSIMITVPIQLKVVPIESGLFNDLKLITKLNNMNDILTFSPIIELKSEWKRKLLKPAILQIPVPHPPNHNINNNNINNRLFSAGRISSGKIEWRPKSALTSQNSCNETNSHIKLAAYSESEQTWKVVKDFIPNLNKNGDVLTVEMERLDRQKFVAVRCSEDLSEDKILKALSHIEQNLDLRPIKFVIAQHVNNPSKVVLATGPSNKMSKIQKLILDQGYSEESMVMSPEFIVYERDTFKIGFRGNLVALNDSEIKFIYNSQLVNKVEFFILEKDKFAQKSKDTFQGYISITKMNSKSDDKLWEIVMNIPKLEQEIKKSFRKDFNFKATDLINKEYLMMLAQEIGEDWRYLGHALKIPEESIKRIANDSRQDINNMAYECLLKWIKNTTVYSNKVEIMEKALRVIGRLDLAKELRYRTLKD